MTKLSSLALVALAGLLAAAQLSTPAAGDSASENVSIVELYTSQGCSSCPAAARVLTQLSQRPDIIPLSFPVAYFDYLGWKDTLARPEYAERQRNYAKVLSDGEVYTPQAVVNGMRDCIGSNPAALLSAVKVTADVLGKDAVSLSVRHDGGKLIADAGAAPLGSQYKTGKLWAAAVQRSLTVPIGRGENAGSVLTYTNVVRKLTDAGDWEGSPASYALPSGALSKDSDMLVVFLQTKPLGPIIAAARVIPGS